MPVIIDGEDGSKVLELGCRDLKTGLPCTVRVSALCGGFKIHMPGNCEIETVHLMDTGEDWFTMDCYRRGDKEFPFARTHLRGSSLRSFFSMITEIEMPKLGASKASNS